MINAQKQQVLNELLGSGFISSWDAIQKFRITRLSQYILLLRQEGYEIESEWQHNESRRWVKYVLKSPALKVEENGQFSLV
jgi:hypothetical protein